MFNLASSTHDGYAPQHLIRQLERIESLPPTASGAFLVGGGERVGTICVEHGQVCWAVSKGMARRLTDLLCEHDATGKRRDELERIYQRCRSEGMPLGQTLVNLQLVSAEGLRTALARQTVESLMRLSPHLDDEPAWVSHESGSYKAMFTFDPVETAALIGAELHHAESRMAGRELRAVVPPGCFAAAFVPQRDYMDQFPVAVVASRGRSITTALDLGRWGNNLLQISDAVAESQGPVSGVLPSGQAVVAWCTDTGLCVAVCEDLTILSALLSRLRMRSKARLRS